ncbi:MAG: hypothetical protein EBR81_16475, partial [Proteobacteria bacterium]|nr:hypothetical protein [Pseudomonadota bacterium]
MTGSGKVTKGGAGLLTLSNDNNTYAGGTEVKSGTIKITDGALSTDSQASPLGAAGSQVTVDDGAALWLSRDRALEISQPISGSGAILLESTSVVKLTGDNSGFSGTLTLSKGTLQIGEGGNLGTGSLQNNAELLITRSGSIVVSGAISGTGKLVLAGTVGSQVTLSSKSDFTGDTEVTTATLKLSATASISKSAVLRIQTGGMLDVTAFANGYAIPAGQSLAGDGGKIA